jgi:Flp pilus assembly protein TadD
MLGMNRYAADDRYRQALAALRSENYEQAAQLLQEATELAPRQPEFQAALGLAHYELAEWEEARTAFAEAVRLNRYEMLGNYGLGALAYREGQFETALTYLLTAYYADQNRPETLYLLALAYARTGDMANAASMMLRAHEIFERSSDKRKARSQKWLNEWSRNVVGGRPRAGSAPIAGQTQPRLPTLDED